MVHPRYPKLFECGFLGNLKVKNRIIFAPVSTNLAGVNGEVTERLIDHYYRIAKGGCGLVIVENACIHFPYGRHGSTQPRIDSDIFIPGLYSLAQTAHHAGAKVGIELTHPGGAADPKIIGERPIAPSSIPMGSRGIIPRELSKDEIEELACMFGEAAERARRAFFDMVEIQAGHGLLINQFLSPLTNKRTDEFGGDLEGRVRFPAMIIRRIKEYAGDDFPVSVRLGVEEFSEGGIGISEGKLIAKRLCEAGADAIHVTLGKTGREKRLEPMPYPQGWRTYLAEEIKRAIDVPVIVVGVIREPWYAEKILEEGKADYVALGRALLADPEWPKKAFNGDEVAIRRCISCNECVRARHYEGTAIRCSLNPEIGFGREHTRIERAKTKKRVMVIGAGPAGMEASRVCALRGHEVHLYDKDECLGGALNIASAIPGKEKLRWIIEYYSYELKRLGVNIKLKCPVNRSEVERLRPDVIIVATGAEPYIPDIPGVENRNVVVAHEVLRGKISIENSRVAVIGGGLIGLETAKFLALKKNQVTVLKRYRTISRNIEPLYASHLLSELKRYNVRIIFEVDVEKIEVDGVIISKGGETTKIPAEWIVLARGLIPSSSIIKELDGYEIHLIGDCLKPRRIYHAIFEGFTVARLI
ncbi:NADH oxidase [Candidatus Bathyarchaeota archaeon]|nr:MAG: NADH oxidase [Candidatus Bathyarchaeota archaeon]